jgi:hypothetical protein
MQSVLETKAINLQEFLKGTARKFARDLGKRDCEL